MLRALSQAEVRQAGSAILAALELTEEDRIQPRVLEKLMVILVAAVTEIRLLQLLDPVLAQVANGHDLAIRVQMPLKRRAKTASHHPDANRS